MIKRITVFEERAVGRQQSAKRSDDRLSHAALGLRGDRIALNFSLALQSRGFSSHFSLGPSRLSDSICKASGQSHLGLGRENCGPLATVPEMSLATCASTIRQAQCHFRSSRFSRLVRQPAFARLLSSLAVLEQREGKLNNASLSAVTAAQKLGGSITGFIAGSGAKAVAEEAAKVNGLKNIITIENGSYDRVLGVQ